MPIFNGRWDTPAPGLRWGNGQGPSRGIALPWLTPNDQRFQQCSRLFPPDADLPLMTSSTSSCPGSAPPSAVRSHSTIEGPALRQRRRCCMNPGKNREGHHGRGLCLSPPVGCVVGAHEASPSPICRPSSIMASVATGAHALRRPSLRALASVWQSSNSTFTASASRNATYLRAMWATAHTPQAP